MTTFVDIEAPAPGLAPDYADARQQLVAHLESGLGSGYPLMLRAYKNPVDLDSATSPFVFAEVHWNNAKATGIGANANQRVHGSFHLTITWVEGTGTASINNLMTYLTGLFANKNLGKVVTTVPFPGKKDERHGWETQDLVVPFWFDSIA